MVSVKPWLISPKAAAADRGTQRGCAEGSSGLRWPGEARRGGASRPWVVGAVDGRAPVILANVADGGGAEPKLPIRQRPRRPHPHAPQAGFTGSSTIL